ncbi:MAG: thermonuclease family protein [Salinarimonas sp.]
MSVKIFWQPSGFELDSLKDKRLVNISDGDTPNIRMNVRMLSIDTPETGTMRLKAAEIDDDFNALAGWIETDASPVDAALAAHLRPRLARPRAASLHREQGAAAKAEFQRQVDERLTRPSGSTRSLFVRAADERFDGYGRLLAYVAPSYSPEERETMTRRDRATFNLTLVESGWAASFVIYPSIPGERDLPLLVESARTAVQEERGAWGDDLMLTGYEYRMCCKLVPVMRKIQAGRRLDGAARTGWIERYCVDVSTAELHGPQGYVAVAPWNRLFLWPKDVRRAVADLNLVPAPGLVGA